MAKLATKTHVKPDPVKHTEDDEDENKKSTKSENDKEAAKKASAPAGDDVDQDGKADGGEVKTDKVSFATSLNRELRDAPNDQARAMIKETRMNARDSQINHPSGHEKYESDIEQNAKNQIPVFRNEAQALANTRPGEQFVALFIHDPSDSDDARFVAEHKDKLVDGRMKRRGMPESYWADASKAPVVTRTETGWTAS